MSEELQKIIDEEKQKDRDKEKQQSVFEMLKDNIKLEKIIQYERVTKEFVMQVANDNNLHVNEGSE